MSKLSFRARALDASKPMPVFRTEEVPDLPDFAAINRAVPQMPTGMEKEEECEHHLQRAMSAQQAFGHTVEHVIPTPEVFKAPEKEYDDLYPSNYKISRQLIHMQLVAMEQDIPDYDMDSEDELWLNNQQSNLMELTAIKFEEIMDRLEKSSGQHVVTLKEAKLLLKDDDDLIIAVYDYWLNKRLKLQQPLIPLVKTEKRDGTTSNNPYVAFRRRTEKMQTRKNRKNDETSYEKMIKLRRDLSRAVNILEFIKHREKTKHDHLKLNVEIFEKRYNIGDFNGQILNEVSALRHIRPPSFHMPINNVQLLRLHERGVGRPRNDDHTLPAKRKREYRRRQRPDPTIRYDHHEQNEYLFSSDDDGASIGLEQTSDIEEPEDDPDGTFAFRRKRGCMYHAPLIERLGNWPWFSPDDGGIGDVRYRFCLTSLTKPKNRCIGFSRRRIGRGGRIIFDRAYTPLDDHWSELNDYSRPLVPNGFPRNEFLNEIRNEWLHFRPRSPQHDLSNSNASLDSETVEYDDEGNVIPVVPISLKDYLDDGFVFPNNSNCGTEIDYASFQSHQEELFEMQRKQLERLKSDDRDDSNCISNTGNMCNSGHSAIISCVPSASSSTSSTSTTSLPSSSSFGQFSKLESDRVLFAVSAVKCMSEVSELLNPPDCSKVTLNNLAGECNTQVTENDFINNRGNSSNGPLGLGNEILRKTKCELLPSQTDAHGTPKEDTIVSSTTAVPSPIPSPSVPSPSIPSPSVPSPAIPSPAILKFKYKIQNLSQNNDITSKASLPPADVT